MAGAGLEEDYNQWKQALGTNLADKLQITYVKEIRVYNEAHMVLAYFATPDAEPVILDNINKAIQPASTRKAPGTTALCSEEPQFCFVPLWTMELELFRRLV